MKMRQGAATPENGLDEKGRQRRRLLGTALFGAAAGVAAGMSFRNSEEEPVEPENMNSFDALIADMMEGRGVAPFVRERALVYHTPVESIRGSSIVAVADKETWDILHSFMGLPIAGTLSPDAIRKDKRGIRRVVDDGSETVADSLMRDDAFDSSINHEARSARPVRGLFSLDPSTGMLQVQEDVTTMLIRPSPQTGWYVEVTRGINRDGEEAEIRTPGIEHTSASVMMRHPFRLLLKFIPPPGQKHRGKKVVVVQDKHGLYRVAVGPHQPASVARPKQMKV